MFGKLIDGNLVIAGNTVKEGNTTITNPTEEKLKELGYKEIEYTEKPEFDKENEKLSEVYTDEENITVSYEKVELSPAEHNAVIKQEIVEEEGKMTARNLRGAVMGDTFAYNKLNEIEANIATLRAKLVEEPKEEDNGN